MITGELPVERFNRILNDPEVRPWVGGDDDGLIDVSEIVKNPDNVLVADEFGGCCFIKIQPGIYEVHSAFLPEGRGHYAHTVMRAAVRRMFFGTDCFEILARVPEADLPAKMATIASGWRALSTRHKEWLFQGKRVDATIYSIHLLDWLLQADGLAETGRWLHDRIRAEAQRLDIDFPPQQEDENHNRVTGAAFEMARLGALQKSCLIYNRWASVGRRALIEPVSLDPPTIRFDIGLVVLRGGDIEMLRPC